VPTFLSVIWRTQQAASKMRLLGFERVELEPGESQKKRSIRVCWHGSTGRLESGVVVPMEHTRWRSGNPQPIWY
jgi:hypothetical protein